MRQQELVYKIAQHELRMGVKEFPGKPSNPRVELYHYCSILKRTDDVIPWCASGMNFCVVTSALILDEKYSQERLAEKRFSTKEIDVLTTEARIISQALGNPKSDFLPGIYKFSLGTRSNAARSFLNIGQKSDGTEGDFVIFSRTSDPAKGHVALLKKKGPLFINVLGANQSDKWCYADYAKWRLLGYRRI